jgi:hypothetical protein
MDVEVPSAKTVTTVRRNLAHMRQYAVLEIVDVERAWVFGLGPLGIVAASYDEHGPIAGRCPDLMEVDALLEIVRLLHFIADAAIALDPVNGDVGGEVISDEHVFAGVIDADMNRPLSQLDQVAMEREFTQWRDPECRKIVLVGRISGHRRDPDAPAACRYV